MNRSHTTQIRVRYAETDAMGVLHHGVHLIYFEIGRTEALREIGGSYAEVEKSGRFLIMVEATVKYRSPARYDDLLTLTTTVSRVTPAKLEHTYELHRDQTLIATGRTVLACVDADGKVHRVSDALPELTDPTG
ncbi:MAG: thioesterase family protein [Planctomycetota bacterium]